MGSVGEYWNDHKEYQQARKMGMSVAAMRRIMDEDKRQQNKERRAELDARKTLVCQCGKRLLDTASHNQHKTIFGKKGHSLLQSPEALKEPNHE